MTDILVLVLQAALAANILLAAGLGLGSFPEGPARLKKVGLEAGAGILVVVAAVSLARAADFYQLQFLLPRSFRILVFFLFAYLLLKAAAIYGKMSVHESILPLALAVSVWVREDEMFAPEAAGYALGVGLGVWLVLSLAASVMERLDFQAARQGQPAQAADGGLSKLASQDHRIVPLFFVVLGVLSLVFKTFAAIL